jgi:hypothetical protein
MVQWLPEGVLERMLEASAPSQLVANVISLVKQLKEGEEAIVASYSQAFIARQQAASAANGSGDVAPQDLIAAATPATVEPSDAP